MIVRRIAQAIKTVFLFALVVYAANVIGKNMPELPFVPTLQALWNTTTTPPAAIADEDTTVNIVSTEAIVTAMYGLNRWETQGATVTGCALVDNNEMDHFYSFFVGETLELCGTGVVIAGVDMTQFNNAVQIENDGRTVSVTVPDSQVFSLTVDQTQMRRNSGSRGWFAPDKSAFLNQTAQVAVQEAMLADACKQNITQRAADEFITVVTAHIKAVNPNITTVNVFINAGDCKTIAPTWTK
ncbi:MAG: hypothetical protein RLY87_2102 [Chloroflexota bacterium]|jgi:hypothetical protein